MYVPYTQLYVRKDESEHPSLCCSHESLAFTPGEGEKEKENFIMPSSSSRKMCVIKRASVIQKKKSMAVMAVRSSHCELHLVYYASDASN